jgi:hypothetical protein
VKIVNEGHNDWDEKLEPILFSYRVAKHRSTGYSPFFLMYHREARLPIDVELLPLKDECSPTQLEDYVEAMMEVRDGMKPKVMANITKAQEYQKQYYDRRHTTQVCSVMFLCHVHFAVLDY